MSVIAVAVAEVRSLLDGVIDDPATVASLEEDSALLGHLPDLDSIGLVNLVMAIEERYGVTIEDDELERSAFETVGALRRFIDAKREGG